MKNIRCTSTRRDTERKTENQVESVGLKEEEDPLDRTKWKSDNIYHSGDLR